MFEARARGRTAKALPGENKVLLLTAPNEKAAESILESLSAHGIDSSARRRVPPPSPAGSTEIPRPVTVEILVRRSDVKRARRIVR